MAFLSVMYSHPSYDRTGLLIALSPTMLTNEEMELLTSSSSTADTSHNLTDGLEALAYNISRERSYISRTTDFPFLSQTLHLFLTRLLSHRHHRKKTLNL